MKKEVFEQDIFGKQYRIPQGAGHIRKDTRGDYDGFVEKFKPKKTTDDCYTPPVIYEAVLDWVRRNTDISDTDVIVRPFYPGGDYENFDYPDNCVVVDNPPFSIISKIAAFYEDRNIQYFLFAPHLTLFSVRRANTFIVCGAEVSTSFVSNLFGDTKIMTAPELRLVVRELQGKAVQLIKYQYPANVITATSLERLTKNGVCLKIADNQCARISALDSQRRCSKTIFGGGFFVSDGISSQIELHEREMSDGVIAWELSERERQIIKTLG